MTSHKQSVALRLIELDACAVAPDRAGCGHWAATCCLCHALLPGMLASMLAAEHDSCHCHVCASYAWTQGPTGSPPAPACPALMLSIIKCSPSTVGHVAAALRTAHLGLCARKCEANTQQLSCAQTLAERRLPEAVQAGAETDDAEDLLDSDRDSEQAAGQDASKMVWTAQANAKLQEACGLHGTNWRVCSRLNCVLSSSLLAQSALSCKVVSQLQWHAGMLGRSDPCRVPSSRILGDE